MSDVRLTAKGLRTRQRIVEATAQQILAAGIGGTSLDDVRAATLTSKSQLFHYFPGGKHELVRAVAEWEGDQLMSAQRPHIDDLSTRGSWELWRSGLVEYYIGLGRWACPIGSLANEAANTDPELARVIAGAFETWRGLLATGVERMQGRGHVDTAADPQRVAAAILSAIQGGLVLSQPLRDPWPLEAALEQALHALDARPATG